MLKDTLKHQGLRNHLVRLLQQKGIQNTTVLEAIQTIPRHFFLDSGFENHAYQDKAFPIGSEQTISHPYTVAFQTTLLDLKPKQKILEIGTGCGYQTAILDYLGAEIYTLERHRKLYLRAKLLLEQMGIFPKYMNFGDGYKGLEKYAPYDAILVTAGAPYIPKALLKQLALKGKLIIPVGQSKQIMTRITKHNTDQFSKETFGEFQFVPLLEDIV